MRAIRDTRSALRALSDALDRLEAAIQERAPRREVESLASPAWPEQTPAMPEESPEPASGGFAPVDSGWGSWPSSSPPMEPGAWPYPGSKTPEPAASSTENAAPARSEDEAAREEVRLAVERLRSELGSAPPSLLAFAGPTTEDHEDLSLNHEPPDAAAEEPPLALPHLQVVASEETAERAASAGAWNDAMPHDETIAEAAGAIRAEPEAMAERPDSDTGFDVREQVRRAVEEAKAELQADTGQRPAGSIAEAFDAEKLRVPHYEPLLDERFLQPAILVIDDPEGRVELVRVYRTLARLEVAATANLANYSSHSVTVQLEERQVPDRQDIADAIQYAFERDCSVDIDGNRASVRLFGGKTRVA